MKLPCLLALLLAAGPAAAATSPRVPNHPQVFDFGQRIDANEISMGVTNVGAFASDLVTGGAGLEYPRGSGKTAVYAGGLWLGAMAGGLRRGAIAEYSQEYIPGIVGSDFNAPEFRVFKLFRHYATLPEAAAALADYNTNAVPYGAPVVSMLPDESLDIPGDQMLWSVCNDAQAGFHNNQAGTTAPLDVEVRQTTWAYDMPGPLGKAVILAFRLTNRSLDVYDDAHVSLWLDPDLGTFRDDLVGCDVARNLGFCYNATNNDTIYGTPPPAVGIVLIRGPAAATGDTLPMTAFTEYTNGQDPQTFDDTWNWMHGRDRDGLVITDPVTTLPTTFMFPGDPVTGIGWVDPTPADQRLLLTSGAFTMAPGQSQDILAAIVIGQGASRLSSVSALRNNVDAVREFLRPSGPTPTLLSLVSADAVPGRVTLRWHAAGGMTSATLERREAATAWTAIASLDADGTGHIGYDDVAVEAGHRYGYRLTYAATGGRVASGGEVWVDMPSVAFALEGFRPNPAGLDPVAWFTLPDDAAARLDVIDVSGRSAFSREVGSLGAGRHAVALGSAGLRSGVYVLRLARAGRTLTSRAAVVR